MKDKWMKNQLLRDSVEETYRIIDCIIEIKIHPDLKTADYTYDYKIEKTGKGCDEWREIFAYPQHEVKILGAYYGRLKENKDGGLEWKADSFNENNTRLLIEFNKTLQRGDFYEFHYSIATNIESVKNFSSLGGSGNVWYWVAHEYQCDQICIKIKLPPKITFLKSEPISQHKEDGFFLFPSKSLLAKEFVLALIIYEKRWLMISPRFYPIIDRVVMWLLGALISYMLTQLLQGGTP